MSFQRNDFLINTNIFYFSNVYFPINVNPVDTDMKIEARRKTTWLRKNEPHH